MIAHDIRGSWLTSEVFSSTLLSGGGTITPVHASWVGTQVGMRMYSPSAAAACYGFLPFAWLGSSGWIMWTMQFEANMESTVREIFSITRATNTAWCGVYINTNGISFGDPAGSLSSFAGVMGRHPWRFAVEVKPTSASLYGGPISMVMPPLITTATGLTDISSTAVDSIRFRSINSTSEYIVGDIVCSKDAMAPFRMPRRAVPPMGTSVAGRVRGVRRGRRVGTYL